MSRADEIICSECGRRGQRGFTTIRGKAGTGAYTDPHAQYICANRAACERRQRQAERREAARGNWS